MYQNLASVNMVEVGMQVTAGQAIGAVGNSAAAELLEESHLHFALLAEESFVDPIPFIE